MSAATICDNCSEVCETPSVRLTVNTSAPGVKGIKAGFFTVPTKGIDICQECWIEALKSCDMLSLFVTEGN